jgi:hypothetical protein
MVGMLSEQSGGRARTPEQAAAAEAARVKAANEQTVRQRYQDPNLLSKFTWDQLVQAGKNGKLAELGFPDLHWNDKTSKFDTPSMFNDHAITLNPDGKGGIKPVAEPAHNGWIKEHKHELWAAAAIAATALTAGAAGGLLGAAEVTPGAVAAATGGGAGGAFSALTAAEVAAGGAGTAAGMTAGATSALAGLGGTTVAGGGIVGGGLLSGTLGNTSLGALSSADVAAGGATTATEAATGATNALNGLGGIDVASGAASGAGGLLSDGTINGGVQTAGQTGITQASTVGKTALGALGTGALGLAAVNGVDKLTIDNTGGNVKVADDTTELPFDSTKLVNTGLGLLGSQLSKDEIEKAIAEQNRLNKENTTDNRAYLDKQNTDYRNYLGGIDTTQRNRSAEANSVVNGIRDNQLTPAQKALYSSQIDATQAGLLSQAGLGNLAATHDATARNAQASSLSAAGQTAADMAKFTPYGITTRFGKSDETGNYTLTPDIKAQQDRLMATSGGLLNQFQGAQAATAPMGDAAQQMMKLGSSYLGLDANQQANKWMTDQQALLDPSRSAQLAGINNRLAAQGRSGLSMGGSSGMMSANPELAAYYNAQSQQNMGLSAQAMQQGMQYGTYGANMVGQGGKTLQDMYQTQSDAYKPYQTAIGGANELEKLGQNALTIGTDLGVKRAAAGAAAGQLYLNGQTQAANATYAGAANPNQYADYYAMQQQGINDQTGLQKTVGNNQANLNNAQSAYDFASPQAAGLAAAATKIPYADAPVNYLSPAATGNPANSIGGQFLTNLAGNGTNWGQVGNALSGIYNGWFGGTVP